MIVKHSIHQLGEALFFKRFDDIFEVVFRLTHFSHEYVAEFKYAEIGSPEANEPKIILNRIYDKIHPVRDITYFKGQLLILGKH